MIILMSLGRQDVVDAHFGFSKFGFLIPAIMNTCVGTYQEIASRKTISAAPANPSTDKQAPSFLKGV